MTMVWIEDFGVETIDRVLCPKFEQYHFGPKTVISADRVPCPMPKIIILAFKPSLYDIGFHAQRHKISILVLKPIFRVWCPKLDTEIGTLRKFWIMAELKIISGFV